MLWSFILRLELSKVVIEHLTYHHFTGSGDSDLDQLLHEGSDASELVVSSTAAMQDLEVEILSQK